MADAVEHQTVRGSKQQESSTSRNMKKL